MGIKRLADTPEQNILSRIFSYRDDFFNLVTGDFWTTLVADSGSAVTIEDAAGGVVKLVTGGVDNDEVIIKSTKEIALIADGKPISIRGRLKFTEANTDDANIGFGLMDAAGANTLQDNGAGPKSSYSGAVFFKEDGQTLWSVESSLAGAQITTQLSAANTDDKVARTSGGGTWQELQIDINPISSVEAEVLFYIDGVLVKKHLLTYTSATEMQAFFYAKAGGANVETLYADFFELIALR